MAKIFYVSICICIVCLVFYCWGWLTQAIDAKNTLNIDVLSKVALLFGGIAGFFVAFWRARCHDRQTLVSEQGYITDRFIKATEQIGSDKEEVRLGAIFSLLRIGEDSSVDADKKAILDMLCAYVRTKQKRPPEDYEEWSWWEKYADDPGNGDYPYAVLENSSSVALLHLIDRNTCKTPNGYYAKLSDVFLGGYHLRGAKIENVNMENSLLLGIKFDNVEIRHSDFEWSVLNFSNIEAEVYHSKFIHCKFVRACFKKSTFFYVDFSFAIMNVEAITDTDFDFCTFFNCNFKGATIIDTIFSNIQNSKYIDMLDEVSFVSVKMDGVTFKNSPLCKYNFSHGEIKNSTFYNCDMTGVLFIQSKLTNVTFTKSYTVDENGMKHEISESFLDRAREKEHIGY